MKKGVVWHPQVYQRYVGSMRFVFIASFFFKNFHERVDSLIEHWGLSEFARHVLIGSSDILVRMHYPNTRETIPVEARINEALGGVGSVQIFYVNKVYRFYNQEVPEIKNSSFELFTVGELDEFQQNPNNRELEEKLRAEKIMLAWIGTEEYPKVQAVTCIVFITPSMQLVQDTISQILQDAKFDKDLDKYLLGVYSGAGCASILLEWSISDPDRIWDLVGIKLHDRLALSLSRTDTFIIANTARDCFHVCQFQPENMGDVARRLASLYPGIERLPLEEQFQVSRLWLDCKRWELEPAGFVRRFLGGMVDKDLPRQRYVIQEIGDKLEATLKEHVQKKATDVWSERWREELAKQHISEKAQPLETWTLGSLAEAVNIVSKIARDRGMEGVIAQRESNILREFVKLRNKCVHAAELDESKRQNLPGEMATGLREILPLYYRLKEV